MSWVVKDTEWLKHYGFELQTPYEDDGNEDYTEWVYTIRWGLEDWWMSVAETDIDEKTGKKAEAVHQIYLERASGFYVDDMWGLFLPKLVELYNDNLLEWRD